MKKTIAIAMAALLLSPAYLSAQNREHMQMTADVRMLQEQTQLLASALASLNQALVESLQGITARLDQASNETRRGFADQKLLIDNLERNVQVIRERSDDTNVRIAALREELEALRATVQALQQMAVAPAAPVDPDAPIDPNAPPAVPLPALPPPSSAAGLSPTRLYETARADYFAGQWSSAVSGFEAFLRAFPQSELADDAQFYIGDSHYAQNMWPEAITAYNQVIQTYPGTNAVPDAYYKRGLAQERMGEVDAARESWEAVSTTFPDSDAGRLAAQSLDRTEPQ
jgi:tol-pal system protein YbgF